MYNFFFDWSSFFFNILPNSLYNVLQGYCNLGNKILKYLHSQDTFLPTRKENTLRDKEEFSRGDPDSHNKVYWLAALNWIVPIICILIGLFITTQKFATLMNYDPRVIGNPLFALKNGYRVYNPLVFILGMFKYAFNDVYSYYFFQAVPPAFFSLVLAALIFVITSIIVSAHQKSAYPRYFTMGKPKRFTKLWNASAIWSCVR